MATKAELEAEVKRLELLVEAGTGEAPAPGSVVQGFGRIMLDLRSGGSVQANVDGIDLVEISAVGEVRLVMRSGREVEVKNPADIVLSRIIAAETITTLLGTTDEVEDGEE